MEISASTTGGEAASVLLGNLAAPTADKSATTLSVPQQQAVTVAVEALLAQAGIVSDDTVDVHLSASTEGKWAVLRVAHVIDGTP